MNSKNFNSISQTFNEKKIKLLSLHELVKRQRTQDEDIHQIVATLISCFSSDPEVITLSCEILAILMESNLFAALSVNVFRRFFRYLPFFFQNRAVACEKTIRAVQLLTQCLKLFEQKCHLIGQLITDFPFTMLFHISILASEHFNPLNEVAELEIIELIIQTLKIVAHLPQSHREADQKIVKKLITSCYSTIRNHRNNLTSVSHLSRLADCLMEAFLVTNSDERHFWIEHRITNIYSVILDRLFGEMPNNSEAVELLLTTVYTLFQRDLNLNLKLEINQQLLDRGDGLLKTLKLFYDLTKADALQLARFNAVVTEVLTHYAWQFEFGSSNEAFIKFKLKIHSIILEVSWFEVIRSDFMIYLLRAEGISASNLWLIVLVRHFEAEQAKDEWNYDPVRVTNYVLNLSTFLSVCCLKKYRVPKFLTKYVLEGMAKFHDHDLLKQNEVKYIDQLRQIIPDNFSQNIFGLLPVSVPRLKWIKQCNLLFKAEFIQRQRIAALEERLLPLNIINASLLIYFPMELLFSVLCTGASTNTAQTNASTILSRVKLSQAIITNIIDERLTIRRGCGRKWLQYLRAIFGSLTSLNVEQQDKVILFLFTKLNSKAVEPAHFVLVIDSLTRILIEKQQNRNALESGPSNT